MIKQCHAQRGVSLVMAVFILVVLSLLGAALIKLLMSGAESSAREVLAIRALYAAESGAQRQLSEIFNPLSGEDSSQCSDKNYHLIDSMETTLLCREVTTRCSLVSINGVNYYTIRSTGRCGPADDPATRIVELQARGG